MKLAMERLERRDLVASVCDDPVADDRFDDWLPSTEAPACVSIKVDDRLTNPVNRYDVDDSGAVVLLDALLVLIDADDYGLRSIDQAIADETLPDNYVDVNSDGLIGDPADAEAVFAQLNGLPVQDTLPACICPAVDQPCHTISRSHLSPLNSHLCF